jgi:chaperone required for assembly of F1-ATPase
MSETVTEAVRRWMKPELPKRFYASASVGEAPDGFRLLLDGRPARTPGRNVIVVPARALAERLALEWDGQGETIDPSTMPLTRLVTTALDGVLPNPEPVRAEIVKYAGSDLLCYRAGEPEGLVTRQSEAWDPVLAWVRERFGARFVLSEGVMFVEQPPAATAAIAAEVERFEGFALAALHVMTTLTGSTFLALAVAHGQLGVDAAWTAAHVDEDWNILQWGEDAEATARRARRFVDMASPAETIALLRA